MKLVLSRKGFDSQYGGIASPILPDGRLLPLPIPSTHDVDTMRDLGFEGLPLDTVLRDLSRNRWCAESRVHLDPQLARPARQRSARWLPAFGQAGAAQGHLAAQGVGKGDLFLFFGWFHEVELRDGHWQYKRPRRDLHVMFGWLEVDQVLPIVRERDKCLRRHRWIASHPHVANPLHYTDPRNTLYVAPEASRLPGVARSGGGYFPRLHSDLVLTGPGPKRSTWRLPGWFAPRGRPPLSYHGQPGRWRRVGANVELESVAKGQEFVLDSAFYPEARRWAANLIRRYHRES